MWIGEGIGNLYDYYECNAYVGVGLPGTGARIYGSPPRTCRSLCWHFSAVQAPERRTGGVGQVCGLGKGSGNDGLFCLPVLHMQFGFAIPVPNIFSGKTKAAPASAGASCLPFYPWNGG